MVKKRPVWIYVVILVFVHSFFLVVTRFGSDSMWFIMWLPVSAISAICGFFIGESVLATKDEEEIK